MEYKNKGTEQAARELEAQLAPQDAMTGEALFSGNEASARAELERLDREIQVGHEAPRAKR